jgi:hypothetical protein
MVRFIVVALGALLVAHLGAAEQDTPQPPVLKVTAEDLVKEFQKDADTATKKYLPPRKGAEGGVLITITGVVQAVDSKAIEVALRSGSNSRVILHAKKIDGIKVGDTVRAERGRFRTYQLRTILIDCDAVKPVTP